MAQMLKKQKWPVYLLFLLTVVVTLYWQSQALNVGFEDGQHAIRVFRANCSYKFLILKDSDVRHPRLYLILLKIFLNLFGNNENAARLSTIAFSPLALLAIYAMLKDSRIGQWGSLAVVFLTAFSKVYLINSVIPDYKILFMVFFAFSIYFLIKLREERKLINKYSIGYVLTASLMFYFYYYAAVVLCLQLIWFSFYRGKNNVKNIIVYALLVVFLAIPEIMDFIRAVLSTAHPPHSPNQYYYEGIMLKDMGWSYIREYFGDHYIINLCMILCFGLGLVDLKKESYREALYLSLLIGVIAVNTFAASVYLMKAFYIYFSLPCFYYFVVNGFARNAKSRYVLYIVGVLLLFFFYIDNTNQYQHKLENDRKLFQVFKKSALAVREAGGGEAIILLPKPYRELFNYYYRYPDVGKIRYYDGLSVNKDQYYKNIIDITPVNRNLNEEEWSRESIRKIKHYAMVHKQAFIYMNQHDRAAGLLVWLKDNCISLYQDAFTGFTLYAYFAKR